LSLILVAAISGCTGGTAAHTASSTSPAVDEVRTSARAFLDAFVSSDGRVLRHDQGDDIVSEGQAYALLLAQVAGDHARFDIVWDWTEAHLTRPDGLLSWHASTDGSLLDRNSAADADVLVAWALLRDDGPSANAHHDAGRRLASAILDHETVVGPGGHRVLTAGNWATGASAAVDPSYWALPAFDDLAHRTGDDRWRELTASAMDATRSMTDNGHRLPPDWARLDGTDVQATPAPGGQTSDVRYSLDAQRVVVWFTVAGDQAATLPHAWASMLSDDQKAQSIALGLDGSIVDPTPHALPLVAAASAAAAAGRSADRDRLLDAATSLDRDHPTYYGRAWVAIGRALLTTDLLAS